MIGAIERPDSGMVTVYSTEITALRGNAHADCRCTIGFVFQRYILPPALTALDNVLAPVLPYRTGGLVRAPGSPPHLGQFGPVQATTSGP